MKLSNMDGPPRFAKRNISKSDRERLTLYVKSKQINKQNEQTNKNIDTENRLVVTRGDGVQVWAKWMKGVKCMVMDGNYTCGGDHSVIFGDVDL